MGKNKPTPSNELGVWNPVLTSLQKPYIRLEATPANLGQAIAITETYWVVATHWLYKKKWNSKHRIPYKRDLVRLCEPMGNLLLSILNLTVELHAIHPLGRHYANAAMWFDCVYWEMKNEGLADLLELTDCRGKDDRVRGIRRHLKSYKNGGNPHDSEHEPHTWRLIQAALEVNGSQSFPTFSKKIWNGVRKGKTLGFIHAYSAWARALGEKEKPPVSPQGKVSNCTYRARAKASEMKPHDWTRMFRNEKNQVCIGFGKGGGEVVIFS